MDKTVAGLVPGGTVPHDFATLSHEFSNKEIASDLERCCVPKNGFRCKTLKGSALVYLLLDAQGPEGYASLRVSASAIDPDYCVPSFPVGGFPITSAYMRNCPATSTSGTSISKLDSSGPWNRIRDNMV
jgi:hypothetical protein